MLASWCKAQSMVPDFLEFTIRKNEGAMCLPYHVPRWRLMKQSDMKSHTQYVTSMTETSVGKTWRQCTRGSLAVGHCRECRHLRVKQSGTVDPVYACAHAHRHVVTVQVQTDVMISCSKHNKDGRRW